MDSVYKIIELVGTSEKSWEDAVGNVIKRAGESLRDIRIANVKKLDVKVGENNAILYRARVELSFKYEGS